MEDWVRAGRGGEESAGGNGKEVEVDVRTRGKERTWRRKEKASVMEMVVRTCRGRNN